MGQPADAKPANRWTSQRWKASPVLVRLRKGMLYMVGSFGWGCNQAACRAAGLVAGGVSPPLALRRAARSHAFS